MNQELSGEIQRTLEEIQIAIKCTNHQLTLRKGEVVKDGRDLVGDGGVNFRLGQLDSLRWLLVMEDTVLGGAVKLYMITHGTSDMEGEQTDG